MGKLTDLTVTEYNSELKKFKGFDYLKNHRLQGSLILIAPLQADVEQDDLTFREEEEFIDERTHKTRSEGKPFYLQDTGIVIKISQKAKEQMKDSGFDFKEGDTINFTSSPAAFSMNAYKVNRSTVSESVEDHLLIKMKLHEIESVIENK